MRTVAAMPSARKRLTDVGVTMTDDHATAARKWRVVLRDWDSAGTPIWTDVPGRYRWRWQASREADRLARRHGYRRP